MLSIYSSSPLFRGLRMLLLFVGLTLITSSCSPLDIAKTVLGGGPNVNAQLGAENVQGVKVENAAPTTTVKPRGQVGTIDQSETNNTNVDWWVIALLVIGWLAPSPGEIGRSILNMFRRK